MTYQVLARKWRSKSFATLIGQEHVVQALCHALDNNRLHHAWLFTGTRGVGKTTISRILARALNCEQGISSQPCGQCSACKAIEADHFADYVEMDAASNRGVDDMAALLNQAVYAPVSGRFKIYMIDEVHMLTGHAFNAMLKTLEEPPAHVKFILATTDPQKIPVTVLSRCLQFNLKNISPAAICAHLETVLSAENIPFENIALKHIANAASGSMRDALSLLDQSIAHGGGQISEESVTQMLGTVGEEYLLNLLQAIRVKNIATVTHLADTMLMRGLSFSGALAGLARLFHRIALLAETSQTTIDNDENGILQACLQAWDAAFIQLAYQIIIHGQRDLSLAPDEYTGFTMTLLRVIAFRPEMPPALQPSSSATPLATNTPVQTPTATEPTAIETPSSVPQKKTVAEPDLAQSREPESPTINTSALNDTRTALKSCLDNNDWHGIERHLALTGQLAQLARRCEWKSIQNNILTLRLAPDYSYLVETRTLTNELAHALTEALAEKIQINIELAAPQGETPHQRRHAEKKDRLMQACKTLSADPLVKAILTRFDATLDESSVRPLP